MGLTHLQGEWIPLQIKVFSRWFAAQLKNKSNIEINDISKDLKNGVALVELAQILTCKESPRKWSHEPKRNIDIVQNCELALDMFMKDGVHFIGISGRDINENNQKLILGLVWTIISHYSFGDVKSKILSWANERTANYPNINKFTPYDLSLCALLDSYVPEKINYFSLDPNDSQNNAQLALKVMDELGIPLFIHPEDLNCQEIKFDQQILLTQLAAAKEVLENLPQKQMENETEIIERSIEISEEIADNNQTEIQQEVESLINKDLVVVEKLESNKKNSQFDFEDLKDTLFIILLIITMILLVAFEFELL